MERRKFLKLAASRGLKERLQIELMQKNVKNYTYTIYVTKYTVSAL
ncbi:hypothetical protein [Ohtaekwangia koreensis]|nr:hypothetical protein [Ohtaekwangia koreensis]